MRHVFQYLVSIRFHTPWNQRVLWRDLMLNMHGLALHEREELKRCILEHHRECASDNAWKQNVLDLEIFRMLELVVLHSTPAGECLV